MVKNKNISAIFSEFKIFILIASLVLILMLLAIHNKSNYKSISSYSSNTYNVVHPLVKPYAKPQALLSPVAVKNIYNLSSSSTGTGTIAIIDAYNDANIENDLNIFNKQYNLPLCTTTNGCFEKHKMMNFVPNNFTWAIEDALDVEWAHAIAPGAKILLVEARSNNNADLLKAVNYARNRSDVVTVSMSWGGNEFATEPSYESSFTSPYGASFFAASGDNGHGTSWPAVSAKVIGVGGTTVNLNSSGTLSTEVAWSGSGGGVSSYISEPQNQKTFGISNSGGNRASPDVAYDADPNSGFPVYDSVPYYGYSGWFEVGGTSAGAPQWAAISTLSNKTINSNSLYLDGANPAQTVIRDIISGNNGTCAIFCKASTGYDYVTGLGSPISTTY